MAEAIAALSLASSIVSIVQVADRVISLCKFFLQEGHDAPSDLRTILVETSIVKTILQNLQFLMEAIPGLSGPLNSLSGNDGPIEGCRTVITRLEGLLPSHFIQSGSRRSKRRKVMTALAWPLKETKAKKLLQELVQYKMTINLALTTESM
jgi:hypothetical protein